MVGRILEQETAIRQVLNVDHKTSHLSLTWQDIHQDVLESVNIALAHLKELTYNVWGEIHHYVCH